MQPAKTNIIRIKPTSHKKCNLANQTLQLNGSDIPDATEATHLGLLQTDNLSKTVDAYDDNNVKKARRATYSLMASGLHGQNGLDPENCLQLIKTYKLPILLNGLELILPGKTLVQRLERYQNKLL